MHPALQRLVDANDNLERAQHALDVAAQHRRACALQLNEIENPAERLDAAAWAYGVFGKGLSLVLGEAVTGLPGKRGQSQFLVMVGRKTYQPKGHGTDAVLTYDDPITEYPAPDALERKVIAAHIAHGRPYAIDGYLGRLKISAQLAPSEACIFLDDATAALAAHNGVSREIFVAWLSSSGRVNCEARFANGNPCTSRVAGLTDGMRLEAWTAAKAKGGYCRRHGG